MLCERCQKNEATVHVSLLVRDSESRHNFCEACYPPTPASEPAKAAGWISHGKVLKPLPGREQVERITAEEYLEAAARAVANAVDKPVFKHICAELEKLPQTQERLTFEFLPLLWRALEHCSDPAALLRYFPAFSGDGIRPERFPECAAWLEKLSRRCFELLNQDAEPLGVSLSLRFTLAGMCRFDKEGLKRVLEDLKSRCSGSERDKRRAILEDTERLLEAGGAADPS